MHQAEPVCEARNRRKEIMKRTTNFNFLTCLLTRNLRSAGSGAFSLQFLRLHTGWRMCFFSVPKTGYKGEARAIFGFHILAAMDWAGLG